MDRLQFEQTYLGLELGSTRIKAVLIDEAHRPIASGGFAWESRFENGVWTYDLEDAWRGIRACYASLARDYREKLGRPLTSVHAIGISAMMHGYLAFDQNGSLLAPFRTWRNTVTGEAAEKLTALFGFNIPQRWSVAHLYQAMLKGEAHVEKIARLTTLAGYVHRRLTGVHAVGAGEASGMFPIDSATGQYDEAMLAHFDGLAANMPWKLRSILPRVLAAGEQAGFLTEEGAKLLDPSGALHSGIPFCPPEGDAGTGMVATNSVKPRTGNVSAGTSVFLMAVLEKPLSKLYTQIDMVATPAGDPAAMVHCNNCSSDIDAWVSLLREAASLLGADFDTNTLYNTLVSTASAGEADCGGLLAFNYLSGEGITDFDQGRPLFVRLPDARFTLANFMRLHLYTACGTLNLGMDILKNERVALDSVTGHGGFFKVEGVGQRVMAAALDAPVTVMATAGEGGPWGMAILAAYMKRKKSGESLGAYLQKRVFAQSAGKTMQPLEADRQGFASFMRRYKEGLAIERAAVEAFRT